MNMRGGHLAAHIRDGSLAASCVVVGVDIAKSINATKLPNHQMLFSCVFGRTPDSNATFASVLILLLFPAAEWKFRFISFETLHRRR